MAKRKKFLYWKKIRLPDERSLSLEIYKEGSSYIIVNPSVGDEHIVHPSAKSIDDEIRIVYEAVGSIETEHPPII